MTTATDFRALCAELAKELQQYQADFPATTDKMAYRAMAADAALDRARAALLAQPEPEGPTPQPIPVSERLPGPEDCDAEGRCWWGRAESDDWSADWTLATYESVAEFCEFTPRTVWLPAHALPLPTDD